MSLQAVLPDNSAQPATVADGGPVLGQLDIAIIGAGLVGLSTAAMLRKEGHRITARVTIIFSLMGLINP